MTDYRKRNKPLGGWGSEGRGVGINQRFHINKDITCVTIWGREISWESLICRSMLVQLLHPHRYRASWLLISHFQFMFLFGSIKRKIACFPLELDFFLFNSEFVSQIIQCCFSSEGRDLILWTVCLQNCLLGVENQKISNSLLNTLSTYSICSK